LAITNIIYMAFVLGDQEFDDSLLKFTIVDKNITGNADLDQQITQVNVTSGMIALWTVGSALNALYDNLIWTFAACVWCLPGGRWEHLEKYRKYTPYLIMFLVVGTAAVASLVVLIVATSQSTQEDENLAIKFGLEYNSKAESYRFLLSYSMEVALSLAVWYPLMGALLFSGVLAWGKLPVLGGRPYEMRVLAKAQEIENTEEGQEVGLDVGILEVV
jgi:hypothetical protein